MDKFQNQSNVVITLEELQTDKIPEEIGELTDATKLTIQFTQPEENWTVDPPLSWYESRELKAPFRILPESIGNLKNLKSLQLSKLDIRRLPESIVKLESLEFLDLSMNKLILSDELPKLKSLNKLKHLRILGNHFDDDEMKQFKREFPRLRLEYKDETDTNSR